MICKDCNSINIIECYKNGCMVCKDCGLIADSFLLDTRPVIDTHRNINYDYNMNSINYFITDIEIVNALDKLYIEDMSIGVETIHMIDRYIKDFSYNGNKQPLRAYALYEVCKKRGLLRISLQCICNVFDISEDKVHKLYKLHVVSINTDDKISNIDKRLTIIAKNIIPDVKIRMKALRCSREIENMLQNSPLFRTKKPSRMDCAILYYILTDILHIKIKTSDYIKHCDTTYGTLKKHIELIRNILKVQS